MSTPSQDNSPLSGDSQLDSLIHSLGIDLHLHSHSQSADSTGDSQHLLQSLNPVSQLLDSDYDNGLLASGGENKPLFSHHSDPFDLGFHHTGIDAPNFNDSRDYNLTDTSISPQELTTDPFINLDQNLDSTHLSNLTDHPSLEHFSSHSHAEISSAYPRENHPQTLNYTDSGAITPDDDNSVDLIGDKVWFHKYGTGQIGTVDGHKFYRGGDYMGRLGADLNVYDADGHKIGYVTPSGRAYTTNGKLFATGGTARWAAATLVFNTCTVS
jgi:hypothetical protein